MQTETCCNNKEGPPSWLQGVFKKENYGSEPERSKIKNSSALAPGLVTMLLTSYANKKYDVDGG